MTGALIRDDCDAFHEPILSPVYHASRDLVVDEPMRPPTPRQMKECKEDLGGHTGACCDTCSGPRFPSRVTAGTTDIVEEGLG